MTGWPQPGTDCHRLPAQIAQKLIQTESGCWEWTGHVNPWGYGVNWRKGVHRLVYEAMRGPVPEGMELDHLCRNKTCANPDHLEPVTKAENKRRDYEARGFCRNGLHERTPETIYIDANGWRLCRPCLTAKQYRYEARKRAA